MAELLPSELPLIIKKELIKAEDRINKTRTPNIDQDVVGGMPTDKPESTSIGETILDLLCSQQFLKEWAKRLDENKQNNLEFVGNDDGKVMKEGAYGLGDKVVVVDDLNNYTKTSFVRSTDIELFGDGTIRNGVVFGYAQDRFSGIFTAAASANAYIYSQSMKKAYEILSRFNTYSDINGFLKDRNNSLYALTNNKLTSDLNVDRTDYIASAKSAHDINKKAISAQNTANTADANAKTAQSRADSAYSLADSKWSPQSTSGTGTIIRKSITDGHSTRITTAQSRADSAYALAEKKIDKTSIANTLGSSTTLVASQKLVNDVNNKILGVGQKWVDQTSNRTFESEYVNNTGGSIIVSVSTYHMNLGRSNLVVDGVILAHEGGHIGGNNNIHLRATLTALVQPGSRYSIRKVTGDVVIERWMELR